MAVKNGILLSETTVENLFAAAEQLRKSVQSLKIDYEGKGILITMSFGIASSPPNTNITKGDLIKRADSLLYWPKRSGRNNCMAMAAGP
jgi:diguanylate cyclase (GGDEF)-like protein